jgi:hypothetical protein
VRENSLKLKPNKTKKKMTTSIGSAFPEQAQKHPGNCRAVNNSARHCPCPAMEPKIMLLLFDELTIA